VDDNIDFTAPWKLLINGYRPDQEKLFETLFCQANGYLGVRGYAEEGIPGRDTIPRSYHEDEAHLPQQYIACLFDHSPVTAQTLVNLPTLRLTYILLNGERLDLAKGNVARFSRALDMRTGLARRSYEWTSPAGNMTRLQFESFLGRDRRHILCTRITLTPLNWSGTVALIDTLDGRAATLEQHHLDISEAGAIEHGLYMATTTRTSNITAVILKQTESKHMANYSPVVQNDMLISREISLACTESNALEITQYCALATSADRHAEGSAMERAKHELNAAVQCGFNTLLTENETTWSSAWAKADIQIDNDDPALQGRLRFYLYQLMQAYRADDSLLGIGAKMLSGQHYAGHYFWDTEIFMLPFYLYTDPDAARELLQYRIDDLDNARAKATAMGYRGAFYPWEGDPLHAGENCPRWWKDEKSGKNVRILCGEIELHINTAIVYGLDHHRRVTGDDAFWFGPAAPVILECARFWADRGEWDGDTFVIRDVIGPDEYHEHVNNDCYTNFTARWTIQQALDLLDNAPGIRRNELLQDLALTDEEQAEWRRVVTSIKIGYDPQRRILVQDDAYLSLPEMPGNRIDRSMPQYHFYKPDELSRMSMIKQASVLALHHLFPLAFDRSLIARNWAFYEPRTMHDSSLSAGSHAYVARLLEKDQASYDFFNKVLAMDIEAGHGAEEGIHAANAGNAWMIPVLAYGGIHATRDSLWCAPRLPKGWTRLAFKLIYRSRPLSFNITPGLIEIDAPKGPEGNLVIEGCAVPLDKTATRLRIARRPHAVIFDLDGVLVDSAICHFKAWKEIADQLGVPFDEERNHLLRGVSRRESFMILIEGSGLAFSGLAFKEEEITRLLEEKNERYRRFVLESGDALLLPGVKSLLSALRFAGLKLAVASSSRNTPALMQQAGLDQGFFHAVADGNDITHSKPDPEVFLLAAKRVHAAPEDCIVVEDAPAGVEGALRGNMRCLGIGGADLTGAHWIRPSIAETSPEDIFTFFA